MTNRIFKKHLAGRKNPEWWLHLFAVAVEESGDWDKAVEIADEAYFDMPEPPEGSEEPAAA